LVEWVSKVVPLFPPAPAAEGGVVYRNEFITNLNRRKFYIPRVRTDLQFSIHLVKRMRKRIDLLYLFFLTNETRWLASEAAEFLIERAFRYRFNALSTSLAWGMVKPLEFETTNPSAELFSFLCTNDELFSYKSESSLVCKGNPPIKIVINYCKTCFFFFLSL